MIDIVSIRAADQRAITNADQVEIKAISSGLAVPDTGVADETIAGELSDLDTAEIDMEPWQRHDVQLEDEVGSTRDELKRRQQMMGDAYPFDLIGGTLTYKKSATGFYEYCLGIATTAQSIASNPYTQLPRSFERIVGTVLRRHMGSKWESLHTGWPRDEGQPTRFDDMIRNISAVSCDEREWRWDPKPGRPREHSVAGDGGVDFVVWRRSPDNRIGQVFVVGQCACGNDWSTKFDDLKVEKLDPWMRPFSLIPMIRCFTTPFLLSDGNFLIAHELAGWVLDRQRLTMMVHELAGDPELEALIPTFASMFELAAAA